MRTRELKVGHVIFNISENKDSGDYSVSTDEAMFIADNPWEALREAFEYHQALDEFPPGIHYWYPVVLVYDPQDKGWWQGIAPDLYDCIAYGTTMEEVIDDITRDIQCTVRGTMLAGEIPTRSNVEDFAKWKTVIAVPVPEMSH